MFGSSKTPRWGLFDYATLGIAMAVNKGTNSLIKELSTLIKNDSNTVSTSNKINLIIGSLCILIFLLIILPTRIMFGAVITTLVSPLVLLVHLAVYPLAYGLKQDVLALTGKRNGVSTQEINQLEKHLLTKPFSSLNLDALKMDKCSVGERNSLELWRYKEEGAIEFATTPSRGPSFFVSLNKKQRKGLDALIDLNIGRIASRAEKNKEDVNVDNLFNLR